MENAFNRPRAFRQYGDGKKPAFVRIAAPRSSTLTNAKASLVMPNGIRLELQGALDRGLIRELIAAAGEF